MFKTDYGYMYKMVDWVKSMNECLAFWSSCLYLYVRMHVTRKHVALVNYI